MRRFPIIVTSVLLAGVIAFLLYLAGPGIPRAVTPSASCLVEGVVGAEASCEIVVRNEGNGALMLTAAKAPAGVRIEGADASVPAGQERTIRAVVDTSIVSGRAALPITIGSNDPERPELALALQVDIRAYLGARPGYARYIYVQQAREGTITQTVAAADGANFKILSVESPFPHLKVAWREASPAERLPEVPGSQWRVDSTLLKDAPVGAVAGNIVVRTDHPKQTTMWVPVSGFVRPIFAVTPPEASLTVVDPITTPDVRLHVKNFAEEAITVTAATTTVTGIAAAVRTVEDGRVYEVVLTFAPDMPAGPFKGTVRIQTSSSKIPTIEIPLDGTLHRRS